MADDVIDKLQIQMTADVSKASRSIGNLTKKLNALEKACSGMTSTSKIGMMFVSMSSQLSMLNSSISNTVTELGGLSKRLKATSADGTKGINTLTGSVKNLSKSLSNVTFRGIKGLSTHIPRIGNAASKAAIQFHGFSGSLTKSMISARALISVARGLWRALSSGIELASDLVEVQNVVDKAFGNEAYKLQDLVQTSIQDLGMSELTAKQIASRYQAMGSAMGISSGAVKKASEQIGQLREGYNSAGESMADMSLNLTRLSADMASFYNVEIEEVAEDLNAVFTGQTRPLRQYGLDLTQATLQEWALKQGIDADVKSMSQAEKTMLRYQYVMSQTRMIHGDFIDTADTWANRVKVLKQQFQALGAVIGGGLINALKPFVAAMNSALTGIIAFAKTVVNALGKIFGWEFEVSDGGMTMDDSMLDYAEEEASGLGDVADAADKTAKSVNKAAEAQEEYKNTVLGFDELNKLNDTTKTGGSGGDSSPSGGTGAAGKGGASTLPSAISAPDVAVSIKRTKALYESEIDNLYDLGKYINETLKNVLEGIDWQSVYEKAKGFGTGLAKFLNGLISPGLFRDLGLTLANSLKTVITAVAGFVEEFDFKNLGVSLGVGIDSFFGNFDYNLLASTISGWLNGLFVTLGNAATHIGWGNIGYKISGGISTFFETFEFSDMVFSILKFLHGLVSTIEGFTYGLNWDIIGESITETINTFFENFQAYRMALALGKFVVKILDTLQLAVSTIDWGAIGTTITDLINGFFEEFKFEKFALTLATFGTGLLHTLGVIFENIKWGDLGTNIGEGLKTFFEEFDFKKLNVAILNFTLGILKALNSFFATMNWGDLLNIVKDAFLNFSFSEVGTSIIETIWTAIGNGPIDESTKKNVNSSFSELEEQLKAVASYTFDNLTSFYNNFLKPVSTWVLGEGLPALADVISGILGSVDWDSLHEGFDSLWRGLAPFAQTVGQGLITFFSEVGSFLEPVVATATTAVGEALEFLGGVLEKFPEGTLEGIGELLPTIIAGLAIGPAGAAFVGALTLGAAIKRVHDEAMPQVCTDINNTADAITNMMGSLTDVSEVEGGYQEISTVLDKFNTLNDKLLNGEQLNEEEKGLLEQYYQQIVEYSGQCETEIKKVGDAYVYNADKLKELVFAEMNRKKATAILENIYDLENKNKTEVEQLNVAYGALGQHLDGLADKEWETDGEVWKFTEEDVSAYLDALREVDGDYTLLYGKAGDLYSFIETWPDAEMDNYLNSIKTGSETVSKAKTEIADAYAEVERLTNTADHAGEVIAQTNGKIARSIGEKIGSIPPKVKEVGDNVTTEADRVAKNFEGTAQKTEDTLTATSWFVGQKTGEMVGSIVNKIDTLPGEVEEAMDDTVEVIEDTAPEMDSAGFYAGSAGGTGVVRAMEKKMAPIETTSGLIVKRILGAFTGGFRINNGVSGETKGIGNTIMDSLGSGAEGKRQTLVDKMVGIKNSIVGAFSGLGSSLQSTGSSAISSLKTGLGSIHIPLPHFNIGEGTTSIFGVKIPSVSVSWYKTGGLATGASLAGVGEAGHEAILPLTSRSVMQEIAGAIVTGMVDSNALADAVTKGMVAAGQNNNRPVIVNATLRTENNEVLARAVAKGQQQINYRQSPVAQY